jgi:hypothetical protein
VNNGDKFLYESGEAEMGWRAFFLALHITAFSFILGLIGGYPFVDQTLYSDVDSVEKANVLNVAVQLGRLDLASLALAFMGTIVGLAAIYGFWVYGHVVERTAREETRKVAPKLIAEYLEQRPEVWVSVIRENPAVFASAFKEAFGDVRTLMDQMPADSVEDIVQGIDDDDEPASTDSGGFRYAHRSRSRI